MSYYEPAEDSRLLLKEIDNFLSNKSKLKICEVGVGSGFIISNLAKKYENNAYFGTDINPMAISESRKAVGEKAKIVKGDLLKPFKEKFDLIYFNTPYLPLEEGEKYEDLSDLDKAIYGGKKGYEVIEKFIYEINDKLENNGTVFMVFSSLSNLKYIEEVLEKNFFEYEIVSKENSLFEKIICMKFTKSKILKNLSELNIKEIKYLASGKHSKVLEGVYKKKKVIIKIGKFQHIQKEAIFLKKLEKENFVPKMYFETEDFVVRDKLEGTLILDFIDNANKKDILKVLDKVLECSSRLDELGINKFEMTNPYKHIYVMENLDLFFIDFERCIYTDNPKNVTQTLEFFRRNMPRLEGRDIKLSEKKIFDLSKRHKKDNIKVKIKDLLF